MADTSAPDTHDYNLSDERERRIIIRDVFQGLPPEEAEAAVFVPAPSPADSSGDDALPPASLLALPPLAEAPAAPDADVAPAHKHRPHRPAKSFWREILETVALTVVIFFGVKALVQNFQVLGTSMEPNFHTDEMLLVNKAAYFHFDPAQLEQLIPGTHPASSVVWPFGGPKRGDIIVFEYPHDISKDYIKRVIGLPGDTVEVRDGTTYVNGVALNEPYIKSKPYEGYAPQVVPAGNLFVMGDNRNGSSDSRSWGFLPIDRIIGKVMFSYAPREDWGVPPEPSYPPIPTRTPQAAQK